MAGKRVVSVFGSSRINPRSGQYEEARLLGKLLAEAGFTIYNGGYGGTMEAVSRGASEAGGEAIGITVKTFDPLPANRWLTREEKQPDYISRLRRLTSADGFVVLRGSIGTLTELALTWALRQTGEMMGKPLLVLGKDWQPILEFLSREFSIQAKDRALVKVVESSEEVVEELKRALGGISR